MVGTSPNTRFIITGARLPADVEAQKVLFIGQQLSGGTGVNKQLVENIQNGTEDALFGNNSILSQMIKRARQHNMVNRFDAIPLDDNGSGTQATATIAFTGTATENKDLIVQIGNTGFQYSTTITSGTDADAMASALNTAINAQTTFPFTSTVATNTVTVTYKHAGTAGNEIKIKNTSRPAGATLAISAFTGGAGAVDVTNLFDGVNERYQTVIYSQDLDESVVTTWLEDRFNVNNDILDGEVFIGRTGTFTELQTAGTAKNLRTLNYLGNADEMLYFDTTTNIAAEVGAKRALRFTNRADISQLVVDSREVRGGRDKASLPYFNTPLSLGLPTGRLTEQQFVDLQTAGVSVFVPNDANTIVLRDMVTTYKRNANGINDVSFKFLNYVDTSSVVREYFFLNIKNRYGQTRATNGNLIPGKAMTNPDDVKASLLEFYETMAGDALLQAGNTATQFFKDNTTVTLDASTGIFTIDAKIPIVTQARNFDGVLEISFTIGDN